MTLIKEVVNSYKVQRDRLKKSLIENDHPKAISYNAAVAEKEYLEAELEKIMAEIAKTTELIAQAKEKIANIKYSNYFENNLRSIVSDVEYYDWFVSQYSGDYWDNELNIKLILSAPEPWNTSECYDWIEANIGSLWAEMLSYREKQKFVMDYDRDKGIQNIVSYFGEVRGELKELYREE